MRLFRRGFPLAIIIMLVGQAAFAQSGVESDWVVSDQRVLEVDGTPVALCPNGAWIAGPASDGERFCVWDVETLEPTCDGRSSRDR